MARHTACAELDTNFLDDGLLTARQVQLLGELAGAASAKDVIGGCSRACTGGASARDMELDALDYEACYARWGRQRERAAIRLDSCAEDVKESTHSGWAPIERFHELCSASSSELDAMLACLDELDGQYLEVTRRTKALREACEVRIREQERLNTFAEAVSQRLEAFDQASDIARTLGQGTVLASPSDFADTLDRLEQAATYMETHYDFSGAEASLHQLEHLRSRACMLARAAVQRCIERTTSQVEQQLREDAEEGEMDARVLHAQFHAVAPSCKPVAMLLHQRAHVHRAYLATLEELEVSYAAARARIVVGAASTHLAGLVRTGDHEHLVVTVQQACAYILEAERAERELFDAFFVTRQPQDALDRLLDQLGAALTRALRPAVLACTSFDALREAAEGLQVDFIEPQQHATSTRDASASPPAFVALQRVHGELRERLVFQAQSQILEGVTRYCPTAQDLDYPAAVCSSGTGDQGSSSAPGGPRANKYKRGWFPTLECTLSTLARTYRVLEPATFANLAQEAAGACVASLRKASTILGERPLPEPHHRLGAMVRGMDKHLFLVKQLLILREQVAAFECDEAAVSAATPWDAARLQHAQTEMNAEIEAELEAACEPFATDLVAWASQPLLLLVAETPSGVHVADGRFREASEAFLSNVRTSIPLAVAHLRAYLRGPGSGGADSGVNGAGALRSSTEVLFTLVQARFVDSWKRVFAGRASAAAKELPGELRTPEELAKLLAAFLDAGLRVSMEEVCGAVAKVPRMALALAPPPVTAVAMPRPAAVGATAQGLYSAPSERRSTCAGATDPSAAGDAGSSSPEGGPTPTVPG
mmetsp:Transcript_115529/g.326571  ORF Transcript_115529/g.326571 Transcript_115529/m.326571 type:complete len:828 (-) Transcript_115529:105-2588(-)